MSNPYASPEIAQPLAIGHHPRWLRRVIILNGTLLAIPVVALAAVYVFLRFSATWESANQTGAPVAYQHFFWVNVDAWFASAYFTVPNGILAGQFGRWKFRSTKERPIEDAVG